MVTYLQALVKQVLFYDSSLFAIRLANIASTNEFQFSSSFLFDKKEVIAELKYKNQQLPRFEQITD